MLGLVFKTSVRHFVSQVGSTPTSFRQNNSNNFYRLDHPLMFVYHSPPEPRQTFERALPPSFGSITHTP